MSSTKNGNIKIDCKYEFCITNKYEWIKKNYMFRPWNKLNGLEIPNKNNKLDEERNTKLSTNQ